MKIEVEDLKRVKLAEGEVLIVRYDKNGVDMDSIDRAKQILKRIFPQNNVVFAPKEFEFEATKRSDTS